jgi:hypothetical protein
MEKRSRFIIGICLLFIAVYIGIRKQATTAFTNTEAYIFVLGLLLAANMLYYMLAVRRGRERWIVYPIGPLIILYLYISNTRNVIFPLVVALCALIAINFGRNIFRIKANVDSDEKSPR